jgi:hypothetical protein
MISIREPLTPPAAPPVVHPQILFRHPGYDDSNNVLLKLRATDSVAGGARHGLYAQFALEACGIIAGNRWDGWLSLSSALDIASTEKIDASSILEGRSYYFHLPPKQGDLDDTYANAPYPITPTFREWRFPHEKLPRAWNLIPDPDSTPYPQFLGRTYATSNLTFALRDRDLSCRISGYTEETQVAHLCPQKENDWWYANSMSTYNVGSETTPDDLSNVLLLRSDLHIAFDKPRFVFVPKPTSHPEVPNFVIHLLEESAELHSLYQNRRLQPIRAGIEMFFARFAWSIFPLLEGFLTNGERRRLVVREMIEFDSDGFISSERCAQFSTRRSRSPKKRKPIAETANDNDAASAAEEEQDYRPQKRRRLSSISPPATFYTVTQPTSPDLSQTLYESRSTWPLPGTSNLLDPPHETDIPANLAEDNVPLKDRASTLAQLWLANERLRSDPDKKWEDERVWAQQVWDGNTTLNERTAKKWYEICGAEFQATDDEAGKEPDGLSTSDRDNENAT